MMTAPCVWVISSEKSPTLGPSEYIFSKILRRRRSAKGLVALPCVQFHRLGKQIQSRMVTQVADTLPKIKNLKRDPIGWLFHPVHEPCIELDQTGLLIYFPVKTSVPCEAMITVQNESAFSFP
jgi:hypothetical protein